MSSCERRKFLKISALSGAGIFCGVGSIVSARNTYANSVTTHRVDITNFIFNPKALNVKVGDKITWTNKDIVPHTATANDGSWNTGELKRGESATVEVMENMHSEYYCIFHPMMKATINLS